ncbi:MAG: hypothetical protein AVDCRST_MAG49-3170, partial [uncultured Thermomicrobiales bacterium]
AGLYRRRGRGGRPRGLPRVHPAGARHAPPLRRGVHRPRRSGRVARGGRGAQADGRAPLPRRRRRPGLVGFRDLRRGQGDPAPPLLGPHDSRRGGPRRRAGRPGRRPPGRRPGL